MITHFPLRARLSPLALLVFTAAAAAVTPPPPTGAGQLNSQLRQSYPPPSLPPSDVRLALPDAASAPVPLADNGVRVTLRQINFTGDVSVPGLHGVTPSQLQALVKPWLNRSLAFSDLQAMTEAVTQFYRQRDMLLAQASLPPQAVKDGTLTIHITAGRYDRPVLHGDTSAGLVSRVLRATTPPGEVVRRRQLERAALLLAEIPGLDSSVALTPGGAPGTSAPDVQLKAGKRYGGYVGLDNQGDRSTGRSRVMAGVYADGLTGQGDRLRIDLLDAYEKSNLINGSADYSLALGGYGTRAGVNYSHLNYHYSFLQQGYNGTADNWSLYVTHPWIRTARARMDVRVEGGQQLLADRYPAALYAGLGDTTGRKHITYGAVSLSGSVLSLPGGVSGFALGGTLGETDYRSEIARQINFSEEAGTAGQYGRLNWRLNHDQQLAGPLSLYLSASGQLASHNLDISQKLLLGGPAAVRAYDGADGAVDSGAVLTAELRGRWDLPLPMAGRAPSLTLAAFYDRGSGERYADNHSLSGGGALTDHNRVSLAGAGLYLTVADSGNYAVTLTWAHRTGNADPFSADSDRNRVWVTAIKAF